MAVMRRTRPASKTSKTKRAARMTAPARRMESENRSSLRSSVKMQSAVTDEIVEKLKGITLLEASELVKQIEETFGVDASAPAGGMMVAAPGGAAGGAAVAEEFDVIISEIDSAKKIAAIKVVRQLTTLGLKEAKDAVTELPNTLLTGATKEDAEAAKKKQRMPLQNYQILS